MWSHVGVRQLRSHVRSSLFQSTTPAEEERSQSRRSSHRDSLGLRSRSVDNSLDDRLDGGKVWIPPITAKQRRSVRMFSTSMLKNEDGGPPEIVTPRVHLGSHGSSIDSTDDSRGSGDATEAVEAVARALPRRTSSHSRSPSLARRLPSFSEEREPAAAGGGVEPLPMQVREIKEEEPTPKGKVSLRMFKSRGSSRRTLAEDEEEEEEAGPAFSIDDLADSRLARQLSRRAIAKAEFPDEDEDREGENGEKSNLSLVSKVKILCSFLQIVSNWVRPPSSVPWK